MSRSVFARLHRRFGESRSRARAIERVDARLAASEHRYPGLLKWLEPRRPSSRRHVIVIGGGFAGLMAGAALANFARVTVLEAGGRARLGGRVRTRDDGIEAGAELIGFNHPVWLRLSRRFQLGLSMLTDESAFRALRLEMPFALDGTPIGEEESRRIHSRMETVLRGLSATAHHALGTADLAYAPWEADQATALDNRPLSDWIFSQAGLDANLASALAAQFAHDNAAPVTRQSFLANLALVAGGALAGEAFDYFTDTEVARCSRGNVSLAHALASVIDASGSSSRIRFGCRVTRIDVEATGVRVHVAGESTALRGAACVVAAPATALFGPRAIEINPWTRPAELQVGPAVKYLSTLADRFWLSEDATIARAPSGVSAGAGLLWEGSDNQIGFRPAVLSLFAGADAAEEALRPIGRHHVDQYFSTRIEALFPGYAENRLNAELVAWPRIPWIRGGYSCPAPGQVTAVSRHFADSVAGRLFFAGEHTCPPFFGYMEGALQSGLHAAERVRSMPQI